MALQARRAVFAAAIAAPLIGGSLADPASAATFEVVRQLAAPQHHSLNLGDFLFAYEVFALPAAPNFTFAIGDYDTVQLRLVPPAGMKIVVSAEAYFAGPELILVPTDSINGGAATAAPASVSFTTVSGIPPEPIVQGFKTADDWLKINAYSGGTTSSASLEVTEIILSWDVSSFTGASRTYTIDDSGGFANGPEVNFTRVLPMGSMDPGPFASFQPVTTSTYEVTRELAAPQHYFFDDEFFGAYANDVLAFAADPNFTFAIGDYDSVRLRLVPPAGMKIVVSAAAFFSWPGDLNLRPTNSPNSGALTVAPALLSFITASGTPPGPVIEGFKTADDWLKIRADVPGTASSANLEVTEIVLSWDVSAFTGASRTYTMFDAGGYSSGPEVLFFRSLSAGSPDPGPFVSLQPLAPIVPVFGPSAQAWLALALVLAAAPFLARARAHVH